jgi:uncharacterized membrane protein
MPVAKPGDPIGGDTWANYARGFFSAYCNRCHSSQLTGLGRNGAPHGFDWDSEAVVRAQLDFIRGDVGESNYMPPDDPKPSCAERRRLVRWIDAGAP